MARGAGRGVSVCCISTAANKQIIYLDTTTYKVRQTSTSNRRAPEKGVAIFCMLHNFGA